MRAQISNHDYEQLSAYLDGQLTPAEKRKLEERLRAHAELQALLDEMSRTRALLRSAPRRRAPRNFTLTPAMVGTQKRSRSGFSWNLFPVLGFTSAIAALALVATILFQLLPSQKAVETAALQQPESTQVADIVQQTMTAMQATAPGMEVAPMQSDRTMNATEAQNATPPTEKQAAPAAQPQPTATAQAAASGQSEGEATAQPTMEALAAPEQPAVTDTAQVTPPVVTWGTNGANLGATGPIGGGGGGGVPSSGSLLGPPSTSGANPVMGKGGGGGDTTTYGQNIVIPQESVNSQDSTSSSQPGVSPEAQPAQVNPAITGTGPILGVPAQGEGGQIVDRKAILGEPAASQPGNRETVPPQPYRGNGQPGKQPPAENTQTVLGLPFMVALQVLLAVIAVAAGLSAFILRKRAR